MEIDTNRIIQSITMAQVVDLYVHEPIKKQYIPCPFHSDKTPSLRIYPESFYCFGCGVGGNVINFVRHYFGIGFMGAVRKIDTDFSLFMFDKPTLTQHRKQQSMLNIRKIEQEELQKQLIESNEKYKKLCQYHRWLIRQPETPDIIFQTGYLQRLLERYLDPNIIIPFDVTARLNVLKTKFCSIEEVDTFATDC